MSIFPIPIDLTYLEDAINIVTFVPNFLFVWSSEPRKWLTWARRPTAIVKVIDIWSMIINSVRRLFSEKISVSGRSESPLRSISFCRIYYLFHRIQVIFLQLLNFWLLFNSVALTNSRHYSLRLNISLFFECWKPFFLGDATMWQNVLLSLSLYFVSCPLSGLLL